MFDIFLNLVSNSRQTLIKIVSGDSGLTLHCTMANHLIMQYNRNNISSNSCDEDCDYSSVTDSTDDVRPVKIWKMTSPLPCVHVSSSDVVAMAFEDDCYPGIIQCIIQ